MRQVIVKFGRRGQVRLLAEGVNGQGTEKFTENLAKSLGEIVERHKGHHHTHNETENRVHVHEKL